MPAKAATPGAATLRTDGGNKVMDVADYSFDGNPDAVEFCPIDSFHHVLAASTYTLQEGDKPNRKGSISLFNVNADDKGSLELFHCAETVGIFDIKWSPVRFNGGALLGQADADGCLRIHHLQGCEGEVASLREITGEKISSAMCLCLDWNPSGTSITVGLSDGALSINSLAESQLEVTQEWRPHDFEVWSSSFDTHQPELVYSGSDDCKFMCWDLRDGPSKLAFQNSKSHKMGICCIVKSLDDPNTVLTGCYDELLRVWDVRSISKPVSESSICLGGGVWRIKYHPYIPGLVLAACMHNGFSIVKIGGKEEVEVVETYSKHGSLAYGADWQKGKRKSSVVATCSFYDQLLRVWMPKGDIIV